MHSQDSPMRDTLQERRARQEVVKSLWLRSQCGKGAHAHNCRYNAILTIVAWELFFVVLDAFCKPKISRKKRDLCQETHAMSLFLLITSQHSLPHIKTSF